jgi:hypothetical protein
MIEAGIMPKEEWALWVCAEATILERFSGNLNRLIL